MNTIGLILLALIGLLGVLFRIQHWPFSQVFTAIGFFGFPLLCGFITWPVGRRIPEREWWGTIGVMVMFATIISYQ
ncbi:MAG: hypothetical protein HQ500_12985 [Flavobacteriales bacterium]|nr:hypothetical protein [Flavobacteriales bacterium]